MIDSFAKPEAAHAKIISAETAASLLDKKTRKVFVESSRIKIVVVN